MLNALRAHGYTWSWFKRSAGAQILAAFILLIIALWFYWSVFNTIHYRGAVPEKIGLTFSFAATGSRTDLVGSLILANPKACGGAIMEIDDTTIQAIRAQGLTFFKEATQGRGLTDPNDPRYFLLTYAPWQETPLPDGWSHESTLGAWMGLTCMNLTSTHTARIAKAGQEPGSFYAIGRDKMLLIVPSQGVAVYTYTH